MADEEQARKVSRRRFLGMGLKLGALSAIGGLTTGSVPLPEQNKKTPGQEPESRPAPPQKSELVAPEVDNDGFGPKSENFDLLAHLTPQSIFLAMGHELNNKLYGQPTQAEIVGAYAQGLAGTYSDIDYSERITSSEIQAALGPNPDNNSLFETTAEILTKRGAKAQINQGIDQIVTRILEGKAVMVRTKDLKTLSENSADSTVNLVIGVGSEQGSGRVYLSIAYPGHGIAERAHDVYLDWAKEHNIFLDNAKHLWVDWGTPPPPAN